MSQWFTGLLLISRFFARNPTPLSGSQDGRLYTPLALFIYFFYHSLANYSSIGDKYNFQVFGNENSVFLIQESAMAEQSWRHWFSAEMNQLCSHHDSLTSYLVGEDQNIQNQDAYNETLCVVTRNKSQLQEPQLMSNYLIKHMTLYDDRVEITLNSPQMGSPERPQDFPLFISQKYKIQHYQIEMYATIEI